MHFTKAFFETVNSSFQKCWLFFNNFFTTGEVVFLFNYMEGGKNNNNYNSSHLIEHLLCAKCFQSLTHVMFHRKPTSKILLLCLI